MSDPPSVNESFASSVGVLNAYRARQAASGDPYNAETTAALYKSFECKMADITREVEQVQENMTAILTNLKNITPAMSQALIGVESMVSPPVEKPTGPVANATSAASTVDR